jgi:uncharacterized SAM-binding protein YcdF (DUF218 family)
MKSAGAMSAALFALSAIGCAELLHWNASRRGRVDAELTGSVGVIVLGYRSRKNGGVHPIQRWRIEIARRSVSPDGGGVMVFTGGTRVGVRTEAEAMAEYAETIGATLPQTAIESRSLSTWENVQFALPMVEHCDTVVFASDPMHAARARRCASQLRPDLAERITGGRDYSPLERWWLKVPTAAYELWVPIRAHFRESGH